MVGHDWGGLIAWTFAGLHPALLNRLVIKNASHMAIFSAKLLHSSQTLRSLDAGFCQLPILPEAMLAAAGYRIVRTMFAAMPLQNTAFGPDAIQVYIDGGSRSGTVKTALDNYRETMRSSGIFLSASVHTEAETLLI